MEKQDYLAIMERLDFIEFRQDLIFSGSELDRSIYEYKTNDVKEIFDALKRNTWIYDYYVSEGPDERYIVIKNAPQNRKSNYWKSKKE